MTGDTRQAKGAGRGDACVARPACVLTSDEEISALLRSIRRIAVLGIKPAWTGKPAYYVAEYAQQAGYEIVPVPVYYPEVTEILGARVYRRLTDIQGVIDMVNVFRRSADVPAHVPDLIAVRPRAVWMQLGIRHDGAAAELTTAGIDVVMDKCLLVEIERRAGRG